MRIHRSATWEPAKSPADYRRFRQASEPVCRPIADSRASMTSIGRQVLLATLYFAAKYGNHVSFEINVLKFRANE